MEIGFIISIILNFVLLWLLEGHDRDKRHLRTMRDSYAQLYKRECENSEKYFQWYMKAVNRRPEDSEPTIQAP